MSTQRRRFTTEQKTTILKMYLVDKTPISDLCDEYGIKGECIRPGTPVSLEDAIRIVGRYVKHYNEVRLHSAIDYIAPADKPAGRETEIFAARDLKLAEARQRRKEQRDAVRLQAVA